MNQAQKSTKATTAKNRASVGFSEEERAAMKEHAQELKTAARRGSRSAKADGEADVVAKIAEMAEPDRIMAERIHAIVKANAPALTPKLWYGMPAYAMGGKVVCFFQTAEKFKSRYATFGFNDIATLDEGTMWPTAFALTKLTAADEERLGTLVKKAVG
ncbi:iron chaperone [Nocardia sp. NPDC052278]|uniref:iron chaperone n=1 Tax=unclassified Nocardia TaxID=2637762 RepID=UPI0036B01CD2